MKRFKHFRGMMAIIVNKCDFSHVRYVHSAFKPRKCLERFPNNIQLYPILERNNNASKRIERVKSAHQVKFKTTKKLSLFTHAKLGEMKLLVKVRNLPF